MKHRGLSLLLALVFLLSVFMFCTTAFAAETTADGLSAVLTTDKVDYVNGENIGVTLDVTNTSIYVDNIRTELIIPVGVDLVEGQLKSEAVAITSGETVTYSYVLSVPKVEDPTTVAPTTQAPTTQAPTTQAPTTVAPTTQPSGGDSAPETRDISMLIYGTLAVASLVGLIALTFGAKLLKQRWFVLVICAGLLLGMVAPVAANAAVTEKSFTLTEAITIDGVAAEVKAIVTYDLDDNETLEETSVPYSKEGAYLWSPVVEMGYYTANGTTYDGWKSSATKRHEVVAFYLDTLFGAERFTTGNVTAKGEFAQDIFNDDAEQKILIGRTDDVASLKALDHIDKDEWVIALIDGKLVVTGWFDNATAAACRHLYDLVTKADDPANVTLNLPIKGSVEGYVTDIPDLNAVSNATFLNGEDSDDGVLMLRYNNVVAADFAAYCGALEDAGYELYAENQILNYGDVYNLFATYVKGEDVAHVMYLPNAFLEADTAGMTQPEIDALTRAFRPDGNELRIITDSKANLYTSKEANKYEDLGISPKYSLVNLVTQASDGNDIGALNIFTLADGSFIVVDGGNTGDVEQLYNSLVQLNERPDGEIIVAAWIFTHDHGDHTYAFKALAESDYAKNVTIEQVIYNDMSKNYMWRQENGVGYASSGLGVNVIDARTESVMPSLIAKFKNADKTQFVHPHMGQRMFIRNAEVEIFYSGDDDMFPVALANYNSTSLVVEVTLGGQEFLLLGDSAQDVSHYVLIPLFSQAIECDILESAHHGLGGQTSKIYGLTTAHAGVAIWHTSWRSALRNEYGPVFYRGTNEPMQKLNWPRDTEDIDGDGNTTEILPVAGWFFDDKDYVPTEDEKLVPATDNHYDELGRYDYSKMVENPDGYIDLNLVADDYIQVLNLPYTIGDTIDKVILGDYDTTLYSSEDVNVAFLPAFHFRNLFNSKYNDIVAQFESYDADVLILTQADHESTLYPNGDIVNRLLEDLDFTYAHYTPVWKCDANADMTTGVGTAGHLVLSRYPIVEAKNLDLGNTNGGTQYVKEGGYTEGRGTCYVQLDVEGMLLDVFATHFANANSWADFKTQLEENHTGDFWMLVGQTHIKGDAAKAAANLGMEISNAGISGDYNVFGNASLKFKAPKVDTSFQTIVKSNMPEAYTFTAELSHYAASDSFREPTAETDFMAWTVNNYGGTQTIYNTILGELTYVHPEIAVLIMVDDIRGITVTPEELAKAAGYEHYRFAEAWTYKNAENPLNARHRGSIIFSDYPFEALNENGDTLETVVLVADGLSAEGRAYGHVIVKIDGVATDIWFGFHDTNKNTNDGDDDTTDEEKQITRLTNAVKAVADSTGRPFIVYGQSGDFAVTNTSFAGKDVIDVAENVESYICALSGTNAATDPLTLSDYYTYKKDILGITSAFIGDQYWMTFGEPFVKQQLTVENGSGSGSYKPGKEVTVTANEGGEGYAFDYWTAEGLTLTEEQKTSEKITITMPENAVTLTAVYKDVPSEYKEVDTTKDPVTLKVGSMMTYRFSNKYNATYEEQINEILKGYGLDVIALEAVAQNASGYGNYDMPAGLAKIDGYSYTYYAPYWDNDYSSLGSGTVGHMILSKYPITFAETITYTYTQNNEDRGLAHVVIQVDENTYVDIYACAVGTASDELPLIADVINTKSKGDYWMLVGSHKTTASGFAAYVGQDGITASTNACSANRTMLASAGLTLSDSGYDWDSEKKGLINQLTGAANPAEMHWATVTVPVMKEAVVSYGVKVDGEYVGFYTEGTEVTLTVPAAQAGYKFSGWNLPEGVTLTEGTAADETIKFTMPAKILYFTVNYEKIQTSTVTVTDGTGSGTYNVGATVTVTANAAPEGYVFSYWESLSGLEVTEGNAVSTTVKFTAPGEDVDIKAVYRKIGTIKVGSVPTTRFQSKYTKQKDLIHTYLLSLDLDVMVITNLDQNAVKNGTALQYNKTGVASSLMDVLKSEYPYQYFVQAWDTAGNNAEMEGWVGHLILSKFPFESSETIVQVQGKAWTTENGAVEGRGAGHVTIKVDGVLVDVYAMNNANQTTWNNAATGYTSVAATINGSSNPWIAMGNLHIDSETKFNTVKGYLTNGIASADVDSTWKEYIAGSTNLTYSDKSDMTVAEQEAYGFDFYYYPGGVATMNSYNWQFATVTLPHYTVSFDANGGTGEMAPLTLLPGTYPVPECTFTREGYLFDGWAVGSADSTTVIAPGTNVELTQNVTLYATWREAKTLELKVAAFPTNKFLNGKFGTNQAAIEAWLDTNADADIITFTLIDVNCKKADGTTGVWNKMDVYAALQEILGEEYPYSEFAKVWYAYQDPANADPNSNDGWIGQVIFSKHEITRFETLVQEDGGANGEDYPNKKEDRGAAYATIKVGDATVDVFVMQNGNANHFKGVISEAIKNSTADAWIATGSMQCKASNKTTVESNIGETISVAETTDTTGYYIIGGSNITFEDAVAHDVSAFNHYKWHTATAVITY